MDQHGRGIFSTEILSLQMPIAPVKLTTIQDTGSTVSRTGLPYTPKQRDAGDLLQRVFFFLMQEQSKN